MRVNGGGELKTKSGTMVESIVNELIEQIQILISQKLMLTCKKEQEMMKRRNQQGNKKQGK